MPEVILPCPACGSSELEGHLAIRCTCCHMRGPECASPEIAAEEWNAIPRALRWTHEPPKAAGKYWWRPSGKKIGRIRDVFVRNGEVGFLDRNDRFIKDTGDGEWAGPISPPIE